MKSKKIQTLSDYKDLALFLAVNAHNLLIDSYIPGEQAKKAAEFMAQCKTISKQLMEQQDDE